MAYEIIDGLPLQPNPEADNCFGYHKLHDGTCVEVFYHADNLGDPLRPSIEEAEDNSGWYWWSCHPGCLPDSDQSGPFTTSYDALADARRY